MAATLQASTKGLDLVDKARCKKGWAKTSQTWADLIPTSKATLRRFWAGVPIQSETFKGICIAAGIEDWELISNREPVTHSKNDKTVSRKHTKRLVISFDTDIESIDQRELGGIIAAISRLGGNATINLLDVDEGSLKLIFGGSPEDFEKIESLYRLGELTDILDITVQDIHVLSKTELAQTLIKNGGVALDLSYANLSHTELAGANLSHANLSHTELAG
ncbi:MAG: pentapeptide repeat-containing protein, partial [Cyanobacteria bacterium P01_F01_bin.53]